MGKKTKYFSLFLVTMLLSGCASAKEANHVDMSTRETYTVGSGQIIDNGTYLGYIEGIEQSNVGAKTSGRVTALEVKEGDRVTTGQILAVLDGTESKEGLQSAENVFGNTESMYSNTSQLFDSQIALAEEKVQQAEQGVSIAKEALKGNTTGLDDTKLGLQEQLLAVNKQIEQAEIGLDTAKNQRENIQATFDQKEQAIYSNAINGIVSTDTLAVNILDFSDRILGVSESNRTMNDSFEMYLGAKNTTTEKSAETLWLDANKSYGTWKKDIQILNGIVQDDAGKKEIYALLGSTQTLLEKMRTLTAGLYTCLDNSISSDTLPQSAIDAYKSQDSTFRNNVEQSLLSVNGNYIMGIKGVIQSIDNFKNEKTTQMTLLQKQIDLAAKTLELAKQNYSQYEATATGKINATSTQTSIAQKQYEMSQKQYAEALATIDTLKKQKTLQLSQIQTQLSQIKGTKDMAGISVSNNTILAPFNGIITAKTIALGQIVAPGLPLFTIAKDETVKVKIYVGEGNIGKIHEGDSARIQIDSDSGSVIEGNVKVIQPFADPVSKKIPVEIWIKNNDKRLMLGMYVNVLVGGDVIAGTTVPYRFVEYAYGEPTLNVMLTDGQTEKKTVKIVACSDEKCVIDGGITIGQKIVLP